MQIHCPLRLLACPVCMGIGALILHGTAPTKGSDTTPRGHRVLCSPRRKRGAKGCGRSFTVLSAAVLKHLTINAESLWQFLAGIAGGKTTVSACRETFKGVRSERTAHRIRSRFTKAQVAIRALLHSLCPPPPTRSPKPVVQTLHHLQDAFPRHPCPITAFQFHFQTRFL